MGRGQVEVEGRPTAWPKRIKMGQLRPPLQAITQNLSRCGYKETFVQEYDGIKVYHHQGSYQHIGPQVYTWAFYEYRMVINSECWNIIIDENMKEPPGSFPGSSSIKLTHDFCHIDSESSDDEYTSFSFVEDGRPCCLALLHHGILSRRLVDLGQSSSIRHHLQSSE